MSIKLMGMFDSVNITESVIKGNAKLLFDTLGNIRYFVVAGVHEFDHLGTSTCVNIDAHTLVTTDIRYAYVWPGGRRLSVSGGGVNLKSHPSEDFYTTGRQYTAVVYTDSLE